MRLTIRRPLKILICFLTGRRKVPLRDLLVFENAGLEMLDSALKAAEADAHDGNIVSLHWVHSTFAWSARSSAGGVRLARPVDPGCDG